MGPVSRTFRAPQKAGIEGEGNGVRSARLWAGLLGLAKVVVEDVEFDEVEQVLVVSARPRKATKRRCGRCGKRCAQITLVSADAAEWIATVVAARCQNAELCLDPFHIVAWATKALDEVRREVWNAARKGGQKTVAKELKNARFALWKNPGDLTDRQACTLAGIAKTNAPLYRAYLLKEQLRQVFQLKGAEGIALLDAWLKWAWRCRLPAFVKLARSIREHRAGIDAALSHGLSNARVESVNTKLRLLTRIAFGFRSPEALVALAMLDLGGMCPPIPGRAIT